MLFFNANNNTIYKGNKESASPVRDAYALPTQEQIKIIEKQDREIKYLEKKAKEDISFRFYLYGY